MELDFEIDKITESIEDAQTGETLGTLVLPLTKTDLEAITKRNGWLFDWKLELSEPNRQVYKLVAEKEPQTIHGLVSLEKRTGHVFMTLIENAPFNIGKGKKYLVFCNILLFLLSVYYRTLGVACNLTTYGCKLSLEYGFGGIVAFDAKTALIPHYEKTLGAVRIGEKRMAVLEDRAMFLLEKYFPGTQEAL